MTRSLKQKRYSTDSGLSLALRIDHRKDCPHLRTAGNETCASGKGMLLNPVNAMNNVKTQEKI
jgi:hypothetical protein